TQVDVEMSVRELEEAVCERLGLTVLEAVSTADRITRLIGLLDRVSQYEDLADHVFCEARRLSRQIRQALGNAEPVHKLRGRCPHCGSKSIRAFTEREIIMCINPTCACTDDDCVCQDDRPGRHIWAFDVWPTLAEELDRSA